MDGAVDVAAEGSVGILVVKGLGFGLLLALLMMLVSELRSRRSEGVVVDVPGGWQ